MIHRYLRFDDKEISVIESVEFEMEYYFLSLSYFLQFGFDNWNWVYGFINIFPVIMY